MVGSEWAHERPSAIAFWADVVRGRKSSDVTGICLVCGTAGPLLGTIPEMVKSGAIPAGSGRGRDAAAGIGEQARRRGAAGRSSLPAPRSATSAGRRP